MGSRVIVIRTDESEARLEWDVEEERGLEGLGKIILRGGGLYRENGLEDPVQPRVISQVLPLRQNDIRVR